MTTENEREKAQLEQRAAAPAAEAERAMVRVEVTSRRERDGRISSWARMDEAPGLIEALRAVQRSTDRRTLRHGETASMPWALYEALMDAAAPILQE